VDSGVIDDHAALGHHFFNAAQAQRVGRVPAHAHHITSSGRCSRRITLRNASIISAILSADLPQPTSYGLLRQNLVRDPVNVKRLSELGVKPVGSTHQSAAQYLEKERLQWASVIKAAGIRPD
jgi:hypothetical protein